MAPEGPAGASEGQGRGLPARSMPDRATELLLRVAAGDMGAAHDYDDLLYLFLFRALKDRGNRAAAGARRLVGADLALPPVRPEDVDEVAHDATVAGLAKARKASSRFDAGRGDGATWALNASLMAFVDVVRQRYGPRRDTTTTPVDPAELASDTQAVGSQHDPQRLVEARQALTSALEELTDEERFVVLGRFQSGLSYEEIAAYMWGNPSAVRRVDRLLQSARRRLRESEERWRGEEGA